VQNLVSEEEIVRKMSADLLPLTERNRLTSMEISEDADEEEDGKDEDDIEFKLEIEEEGIKKSDSKTLPSKPQPKESYDKLLSFCEADGEPNSNDQDEEGKITQFLQRIKDLPSSFLKQRTNDPEIHCHTDYKQTECMNSFKENFTESIDELLKLRDIIKMHNGKSSQ